MPVQGNDIEAAMLLCAIGGNGLCASTVYSVCLLCNHILYMQTEQTYFFSRVACDRQYQDILTRALIDFRYIILHLLCNVQRSSSAASARSGDSVSGHITTWNYTYYLNTLVTVHRAVLKCFSNGGPSNSGALG